VRRVGVDFCIIIYLFLIGIMDGRVRLGLVLGNMCTYLCADVWVYRSVRTEFGTQSAPLSTASSMFAVIPSDGFPLPSSLTQPHECHG